MEALGRNLSHFPPQDSIPLVADPVYMLEDSIRVEDPVCMPEDLIRLEDPVYMPKDSTRLEAEADPVCMLEN